MRRGAWSSIFNCRNGAPLEKGEGRKEQEKTAQAVCAD
jgi:hypothetical protein